MTKDILTVHNDTGFIATLHASLEPVRSKDKLPVLFPTLSAGKSYLKKRYKENWTNYCFRMARYVLEPETKIAIQS